MAVQNIQNRGERLRAEIIKLYQQLDQSRQLKTDPSGTDITPLVLRFIPAGSAFPEAEALLQAAGFTIGDHPAANPAPDPNRHKDWFGVICGFDIEFPLQLKKAKFRITLMPSQPGNFTTVERLNAKIYLSLP